MDYNHGEAVQRFDATPLNQSHFSSYLFIYFFSLLVTNKFLFVSVLGHNNKQYNKHCLFSPSKHYFIVNISYTI